MIYAGIDPGLRGGVGFFWPEYLTIVTHPMPVGVKGSGAIQTIELAKLFIGLRVEFVLIEDAISLPQQGSVSQATIQRNMGRILATLEASHISYRVINPSTFRKELGLAQKSDKEETVKWVQRIVPSWEAPRKRTGTLLDGQSDAAALACHAWRTDGTARRT